MRLLRGTFGIALAFFLAIGTGCRETVTLPASSDVVSVTIQYHRPKPAERIEFEASIKDWEAIRDNLLPASKARDVATWEHLGYVKIVSKSGEQFVVRLFETSESPGAFAAGPPSADRVYYRGGDSDRLKVLLDAAYEKYQRREE